MPNLLGANETSGELTIPEQRALAPDYASPEQQRGETMRTASDVFSLGVILHELLTGEKPSNPSSRAKSRDPVKVTLKLSLGIENQKSEVRAHKSLRGDLQNIVFKAMHEEPSRRYASVSQFSDDLQRYLDGRPVLARKDTFGYRSAKFIARNRVAVATAALIALTLLGGLVATAWQARATRLEKARAESINAFLVQMLNDTNPVLNTSLDKGDETTVRQLLDAAAAKLSGENFANHPEVRADLEQIIARSYTGRGLYSLAQQHLLQYVALESRLPHENRTRRLIAEADRAELLSIQGKLVEAEKIYRQTLLAMRTEFRKGHLQAIELAEHLTLFAFVRRTQGDSAEAGALFRESLALIDSIPLRSRGFLATTAAHWLPRWPMRGNSTRRCKWQTRRWLNIDSRG